jgi:hypothetical protein
LFVEAMAKKTAAFRRRRAADTARWRERLDRGAAVYPVEVDGLTFDLMERFAGPKASKVDYRHAVVVALGANCCAARWRRCCEKKLLPDAS